MSKKNSKNKAGSSTIALNRTARHEYFIEEKIEAGLSLQGWEVKSLRAGKANISEAYVIFRDGEAYLFGSSFLPLQAASSHVVCDPTRTRKLLLSRRELDKLESLIARQGYTVVPPRPLLETVLGQGRNRPGEGQERARQARRHQGPRMGSGKSPHHEEQVPRLTL